MPFTEEEINAYLQGIEPTAQDTTSLKSLLQRKSYGAGRSYGVEGSPVSRFVKNYFPSANPLNIVTGTARAIGSMKGAGEEILGQWKRNPSPTAEGVFGRVAMESRKLGEESLEAFKRGDISEGISFLTEGLTFGMGGSEVFGGAEKIAEGDISGGAGQLLGLATAMAEGKLFTGIGTPRLGKGRSEAIAPQAEFSRGVPISADIATGGSPLPTMAHLIADTNPIGFAIASQARKRTLREILNRGKSLSQRAGTSVGDKFAQGLEFVGRGKAAIKREAAIEEAGYKPFNEAIVDPRNIKDVQTGIETVETGILDVGGKMGMRQQPIIEKIAIPVSTDPLKVAFKPLYDQWFDGIPPEKIPEYLSGAKPQYKAVYDIMNAKGSVPAFKVHEWLKILKGKVRKGEEDLYNPEQGLSGKAVGILQKSLETELEKLGGNVLSEFKRGAQATAQKYKIDDILGQFSKDPVALFDQNTMSGNRGYMKMAEAERLVPGITRGMGKSYLDDAIAKNDFSKYQKLGERTKQALFGDETYIKELDDFFKTAELVKKQKERHLISTVYHGGIVGAAFWFVNPATGAVITLAGPALSAVLHSRIGVRLLTKGLRTPAEAVSAIRAGSQLAQLTAIANNATKKEDNKGETP